MVDKPILFSGPMVRAIVAGRKTQTRRIITSARTFRLPGTPAMTLRGADLERALQGASDFFSFGENMWTWQADAFEWQAPATRTTWNAYIGHAVGDRLWVREAWKPGAWREDGRVAIDYRASPDLVNTPWCRLPEGVSWPELERQWDDELAARGSVPDAEGYHHWEAGKSPMRWRPGIHMPRWASRLSLLVTDVRIQLLQNISEDDAIAEGCIPDNRSVNPNYIGPARSIFAAIWNDINGECAWAANPWVVAYTFERVA